MLKNILKRINRWYLEVFKDTTREPEEQEEKSNLVLIVNLPLKERIKFLFTNKALYRLNYKEYMWIKRNVK